MAIYDGDILAALQSLKSDTSKISRTVSSMAQRDIHFIQQDLETLVRMSQGTRRSVDNSRFQQAREDRERRTAESASGYYTRSQGTSRFRTSNYRSYRSRASASRSVYSSFDGVVDEFVANLSKGMSEQLRKSLAQSTFHKQLKGYIQKFADDLGIQVSEIPAALGKDLGRYVIQNTRFGQTIASTLQGFQDRILQSVMNAARTRVNNFNNREGRAESFRDAYNRYTQDFRNRYGTQSQQRRTQAASTPAHSGSQPSASSDSEASSTATGNQYNPDLDLFNNIRRSARGIYDRAPVSVKSRVAGMYGKLASKIPAVGKAGSVIGSIFGSGAGAAGAASATGAAGAAGAGSSIVATGSTALGAAGAGAAGAGMAIPQVAIAAAAIYVVSKKLKQLGEAVTPAVEGLKKLREEAKKSSNRYWESQKEMLKEEQKRIKADIETMATTPFKIMEDAAQKWYDAWENQLSKIGQTQGYTKSDVQSLYSSFASRLRAEGLSEVVSAADIAGNLGSILDAGLSGKIAEEFAYQATLLNKQIPTQDFFGYASTYGQLVGNAMARGLNESAAIQEANAHLEQFASNLLYAGRNISQGIATGLKDGSQLFADSVNIALTARAGNPDTISAVTTAVAAELSAIAPDLTSELLQAIVGAATGGNRSELVALRSMAGINAGNTAFLTEMATDPQRVFTALFTGLARMQRLDADNYMEVAEGLSETFGISAAAFQRIDFTSLAQAVSSMQINQSALSENLNLLKSGQTTPGPEALRAQQINKMILDEGLAYVLDNEAARAIQQHMWDQELANEIMERQYSVDLAGSAKEAIQGIFEAVHNILKFLNPFSWIGDLINLAATSAEYDAQKADIRAMLEAGKVGSGNANSFRNLTNYNGSSLDSVPSLLNMMGMASRYDAVHGGLGIFNALTEGSGFGLLQLGTQSIGALGAGLQTLLGSSKSDASSKYTWGFIGKSLANAISSTPMATSRSGGGGALSANDAVRKKEASRMNQLLGSMDAAVEANKSYDEWKAEATKQYKITDFNQALSQVGLSESQVRGQFDSKEAQKVSKHNYEREQVEDTFWEKAIHYYDVDFPEFSTSQLSKMDTQIDLQAAIHAELQRFHVDSTAWWSNWTNVTWKKEWVDTAWKKDWLATKWAKDFLAHWTDVYVKFDTYSKSTNDAYKAIDSVKDKSKKKESGDAVLALAKALTDNTANLKDPTIQSNALLSQILIVLEAILQAENTSGGASLQTSLSALGLGLTTA